MHAGYTRRQVLTVAVGAIALVGCGAASQTQRGAQAPISPATGSAAPAAKGGAIGAVSATTAGTPEPAVKLAAAQAAAPAPAAPSGGVLPLLPGTTGAPSGALEGSTGSLAPAFSLPDLTGKAVDLASLRGRPALLNFLATTCAPCAAEMPLLTAAQRTYGSDLRVVLIGVSEAPADLASFVSANGADSLTALADQPGTTTRAYHVGLIPTSVFLDADGRIAATHVGILDATSLAAQFAKAGVADAAHAAPALSDKNLPASVPAGCCPVPGGN